MSAAIILFRLGSDAHQATGSSDDKQANGTRVR